MKVNKPRESKDLLKFCINLLEELEENGISGDHGYIFVDKYFKSLERSSDPPQPSEGQFVIWMSDGTGKGSDGDVMIASTAGGTTNYGTLFDHSGGSSW